MRRYRHLVTFQEVTGTTRTPSGQEVPTYANVTTLTDLPANIVPVTEEKAGERYVTETDEWHLIVQGDLPITPDMVALTTVGVMDVKRVANPTLGRPATLATIVVAQRVAI